MTICALGANCSAMNARTMQFARRSRRNCWQSELAGLSVPEHIFTPWYSLHQSLLAKWEPENCNFRGWSRQFFRYWLEQRNISTCHSSFVTISRSINKSLHIGTRMSSQFLHRDFPSHNITQQSKYTPILRPCR